MSSGVPQGSILGLLLFLVYAHNTSRYIKHGSSLALFADDSKLYRLMDSVSSSMSLQVDLDCLQTWSSDHGMKLNTDKCKVLHKTKQRSCCSMPNDYQLSRKTLCSANVTLDLGVAVINQLSWNRPIEEKGTVFCAWSRVCAKDFTDTQTRKLLYTALVRLILEYASSVWSPYTAKHKGLLEDIQCRGTKFILNYPPRDVTYNDR